MIQSWGITDKGVVRRQNQDSYRVIPMGEDTVVAMVCDGMGGARAGNVASSLAAGTAAGYLEGLTREELRATPDVHLTHGAELANEEVFLRAGFEMEYRGMGTTMVAAAVCGDKATILNIGDSRAYRIGGDGIIRLTRDHSLVEDLVRRGDITPEQARQHPQKNLITRALGAERQARFDLYETQLKSGEFLLLCSDGLSNLLSDQEMLYEVLHGGAKEECCRRMLQVALSRGAPDNVTVVLIEYVGEEVREDG